MATIKIKNPDYVEGSGSNKWVPISNYIKTNLDNVIITTGNGSKYLANDGTYKSILEDAPSDNYKYARYNGSWRKLQLSDFDLTVSSSDINKLQGVTGNVQQQLNSAVKSSVVTEIIVMTKSQYDSLTTINPTALYIIT